MSDETRAAVTEALRPIYRSEDVRNNLARGLGEASTSDRAALAAALLNGAAPPQVETEAGRKSGLPCGIRDVSRPGFAVRHFEAQQGPVEAMATPLPAWNRHCRDEGGGKGLAFGWHVTVAAATGAGKSLLGLNLGAEAMRQGHAVGFISLEMSLSQLTTRLYAILAGVDVRSIERGDDYDQQQADKVVHLLETRDGLGTFHVNERPIPHLHQIQAAMGQMMETHGTRVFVVDYLQLARGAGAENIFEQVSEVSAGVREFAKQKSALTIGLSQLNRSTSANRAEPPIVQGLMGSSSIENDSDQVLLLDHTRHERGDRSAKTYALLGKNRHGGQGEIPVEWDYRTLRIREALPDEESTWPDRGMSR